MKTKHIATRTIYKMWKIRYYGTKEIKEYQNVF
jgi:DNA-directed RNA polymerase subunit F